MMHLTSYTEIDFQYFAMQESAREDFRRKMAICDPEYLKSWDAKQQEQEALDKATNQLEHDWVASVKSLYDYAGQHTRDIIVKGGHIAISDVDVHQIFNDRLDRSKALHSKLLSSVREQAKHQQTLKAQLAE